MSVIGRVISSAVAQLLPGHSGWETLSGRPDEGLRQFGFASNAGTRVSPESIMKHSAVWACTQRTAQLVASLPAMTYRKTQDGSREVVEDELSDILTISPNREQTACEFWEGMVAQTLIRGNAVAERLEIRGRLVGLQPLMTAEPRRLMDGTLDYAIADRGRVEYLPPEKVFHIRGFGVGNGIGLSAVRYGVHSFGAALAADETAASIFANGMHPGGMITWGTDAQAPTAEQRGRLKALIDRFTGSKKTGKVLELPPGAKYEALAMKPEDAQLLETRRFSIEDICRWFGVPPIVIGHASEGQTMWGSGVEAIMLSWLTLGINPLLKRIERRVVKDLVPAPERRRRYMEFTREAMLQMDSKAKGEFMSKMGASGTMTANERRAKLNLPRSTDPNADRLLAQTALAPLELLGRNLEQ